MLQLLSTMSVAGLRLTRSSGQSSTPLEIRSGSYVYDGDPACFHDWEFRTLMRLKLYEDAIRAKAQKKKARRNSRGSPTPQDEPTDADAEAEPPGVNGGGDIASIMVEAMSQASPSEAGSRSSKHGKTSKPSVASVASQGTKGDSDPLPDLRRSGHLQTRSGKPSGYRTGKGKGKGKTFKAYTADPWYYEEEDYPQKDQDQEDYNEASYQAFEDETTPGYLQHPKADGKNMRTTSYPSPKLLPSAALMNSRSRQKLDMLYSCSWRHMQLLVKQKAKVKASPRKVRAKERAR